MTPLIPQPQPLKQGMTAKAFAADVAAAVRRLFDPLAAQVSALLARAVALEQWRAKVEAAPDRFAEISAAWEARYTGTAADSKRLEAEILRLADAVQANEAGLQREAIGLGAVADKAEEAAVSAVACRHAGALQESKLDAVETQIERLTEQVNVTAHQIAELTNESVSRDEAAAGATVIRADVATLQNDFAALQTGTRHELEQQAGEARRTRTVLEDSIAAVDRRAELATQGARLDEIDASLAALRDLITERVADCIAEQSAQATRLEDVHTSLLVTRDAISERMMTQVARLDAGVLDLRGMTAEQVAELRRDLDVSMMRPMIKGDQGRDGVFAPPVGWSAKQWPQGTMARHRGGLWWSFRDTDQEPGEGDSGWTCVADGIRQVMIAPGASALEFAIHVEQSSGQWAEYAMRVPGLEFRGVWLAEAEYQTNSLTVRKGSCWIAKRDNKGAMPGVPESADDWHLIAKAGIDGKPGVNPQPWNWCDAYEFGRRYKINDVVRAGLTLWIARRETEREPGSDDSWAVLLSAEGK